MGKCSYIHFTKAFKSKENFIILSCIFCLNLFGCWVRRLKVTKPFIYVIYGLAAVPARWFFRGSEGMLAQKLVTLTSTIFLIYWMEILPTQGICKEASLATGLHTNYPCPFCINDFINQEEFIEHKEICSGTNPKPEVLNLICPYGQKTFETYDKIEKPSGSHIIR